MNWNLPLFISRVHVSLGKLIKDNMNIMRYFTLILGLVTLSLVKGSHRKLPKNPSSADHLTLFVQVYSAGQLLIFSEGFLLQNLVALLTYDDR
jgi:hypothetical protein